MGNSGRVWKFLLVDDGEDDFFILHSQLNAIDGLLFELDWLKGLGNFVSTVVHGGYDAVFIEYQFGVINSLDDIRTIRAMGIKVPILMATDWELPQQELWEEAIKAGATFFLKKKETNSDQLLDDLEQALPGFREDRDGRDHLSLPAR
jgi:CheY-like chemotaxis protein